MSNNRSYWLMASAAVALLTTAASCVDNAYDLSDIDTSCRVNVNGLVIPLNLDRITLDQVLDIDDDSEVETIVQDGKTIYAIVKEGSFSSDPIKVKGFVTSKPSVEPIVSTLHLLPGGQSAPQAGAPAFEITGHYDISCSPTRFEAKANNVDKAIKAIGYLGVKTRIAAEVQVSGFEASQLQTITIEGLQVLYPKGLDASPNVGTYDKQTGVLDLSNEVLSLDSEGRLQLSLEIYGIDANMANIDFDADKHQFTFGDDLGVKQGRVNLVLDASNLPQQITFKMSPSVEPIEVTTFSGKIEYDIDNFGIDPLQINDIPEFLSQKGTQVRLANPQLYLTMNNPLEGYIENDGPMLLSAGLKLTSEKGDKRSEFRLDNDRFTTDSQNLNNTFVFAPSAPKSPIVGYENPQFVPFAQLSNVLVVEGAGFPERIYVEVEEPRIPTIGLSKLSLGSTLPRVEGSYKFHAPLQLSDGSLIAYTDTLDGWNDEGLDDLTITELGVSFDCSTEVPFDIELSMEVIDCEGRVIPGASSNAIFVPAQAKEVEVELVVETNIEQMDGIILKTKFVNKGDDSVLNPAMTLDLKDFRAKVSGYYEYYEDEL